MKLLKIIIGAVLSLIVIGYVYFINSPTGKYYLPSGAGITAKQLCSFTFVSELPIEQSRAWYIDPLLGEAVDLIKVEVDHDEKSVTASIPFLVKQTAVYRPGYGCTMVHDKNKGLQPVAGARPKSDLMTLDEAHRDAHFDGELLEKAVNQAFEDLSDDAPRNTLAVLVLHDGKLVAEKYAEGVTPHTRLPGWSMTKSVTATLVGILEREGKIDIYQPGAISEWRGTNDPRKDVSMDHLLRMTSGLLMTEGNDGTDPTSRMLFIEEDGANFAATRELHKDVGSYYEYMSGSTVLAMRGYQEIVGGDLRDIFDEVQETLFKPLGMKGAVMEPDQHGTFVGSSFMFASAQDWARFGQLYVNEGRAPNGEQLINPSWVEYVSKHTPQSGGDGYGASFWVVSDEQRASNKSAAGLPEGTIAANGFQGQFIHMMPSEKLVVVRLGATNNGQYALRDLPYGVFSALKEEAAESE